MIPFTYGIVAALFVVVSSFQGLRRSWLGFAVSATRTVILVGGTVLVTRAVTPGGSITGVWWTIVAANLVAFVFGYLLLGRTFRAVLSSPAPAGGGSRPGGGPGRGGGGNGPPGDPTRPPSDGAPGRDTAESARDAVPPAIPAAPPRQGGSH
jgi:hypothetical protein